VDELVMDIEALDAETEEEDECEASCCKKMWYYLTCRKSILANSVHDCKGEPLEGTEDQIASYYEWKEK
jgi:hypothetical protein